MSEQIERGVFEALSAKEVAQMLGGQTVELPDDIGELHSALMHALTLPQHCDECYSGEHEELHVNSEGFLNTLAWMISNQASGEYVSGPRDGERVDRSEGLDRVYQALPAFADHAAHLYDSDFGNGAYHQSIVVEHACFQVVFEKLAGYAGDDKTRRILLKLSQQN